MNLSEPFILRPVMTTLLMVAALVMGIWAYNMLAVSNLPDVNYPTITVTTNYPGASPEIMANTIATPLEKQFMTIPGIRSVVSNNVLGASTIILQFEIDRDVDLAAVDVDAAIVAARPQLPPNLPQEPTFRKVNPSSSPIFYISVTSPTMTMGELYDYANTFIGQRISIIDGVSQVNVYGSPFAVRTQVDPGLSASLGLSLQDIASVLSNANQYQALGQFDGNYMAPPLYDNGGITKAEGYKPLIVAYKDSAPVRIDHLGIVLNSLMSDRSSRRIIDIPKKLDQPAVTLAVQRLPGSNTVKVADAINALLPELQKQLPGSLQMFVVFDRSLSIRESIKDVQFTLLLAFILVVLVIFIYLGKIRDTLIPSLVMPMSIISTFAVIYILGYTLDNLSLLALTLAIGFIIDDAIVVLENIVRWVEKGEKPLNAALEGSKQISFTIVSMTLSLIAVFIPLIFMAGIIGKLFKEFAVTLTVVTLMSGIISLTLTPMLCARFIPPRGVGDDTETAHWSARLNAWSLNHYKNGLAWVLDHRKTMLAVGLLSILISALLFKILPTDFIPDEDIGFAVAYTEAEQGTSSDQMRQYQKEIVNILKEESSVETLVSISANPEYRQGLVFIKFIDRSRRKPITSLLQNFNKKFKEVPGVNVFTKNIPLIDLNIGTQVRGAYQFLIQSLDAEELYKSADNLMRKMQNDPMFQSISTDLEIKTPQVNLVLDREHASTLGITPQNFEQIFGLGFSGNLVSLIQTPIDQYDVILELLRDLQRNDSTLYTMYARSNISHGLVPIRAVADWSEGVGPTSVNHYAQFPAVTITFNIPPNVPLSKVIDHLRKLASQSFSPLVNGDVKGAAQTFEEAIRSVAVLLIVTVCVIYIVLGMLYESFVHPLTILSTLPPAIVGALITLFIFGMPLSLYAYLGLILLIGIVKKNGIMIVDFALDNIRNKGESPEKSIYDACIVRFRPIMMTTIAAIMGAVPIAMGIGGAESHRPLGFVIIGGMCVSQLITLFLTPVIYLYLERIRERYAPKK